jgi:xanthine dehydrogenase accessory factor
MYDRFLKKADELLAKGEPFAVAVIVRQEGASSGKTGDKAVITADGKLWGWVGGGCTQPVVIKEALKALGEGRARMIRISPGSRPDSTPGIIHYPMTCHSGGTLDIFIEPVAAKPRILILGRSPVARTLARLAAAVDFSVSVAAPEARPEAFPDANVVLDDLRLGEAKVGPQTFIVVSTQGEQDEEGLELALSTEADYIAFVASRIKAEKILKSLASRGATEESLKRVRAPAGMAIGAKSPEEIAVSILAEIVQVKAARAQSARPKPAGPRLGETKLGEEMPENTPKEAIDPICGMTVETTEAKHTSEYQGTCYYFCCAGCKQTFDQQPQKYAKATSA